jgi:hypothetical protein
VREVWNTIYLATNEKALPVGMWTLGCRSQIQAKNGAQKAGAEILALIDPLAYDPA